METYNPADTDLRVGPAAAVDDSQQTQQTQHVFISHASRDGGQEQVRRAIEEALHELGMQPLRWEDAGSGRALHQSIPELIARADLVIVDVTGTNPNVMYELGYAHGLRKPVILLLSEKDDRGLPIDLRGNLFLSYDPDDAASAAERVQTWVRRRLNAA